MTVADWRALIEAYLDGRLSAEAFMRRFMEAWREEDGRPARPVADLQVHVEAFEAQVTEALEDGVVNDDEMRRAAQSALAELADDPRPSPQTFDRTRAREDMRRFTFQMTGCAGAGCIIAAIWVVLCLLQITFVSEYVQHETGLPAWPAAVVGFFLAFVPIVGNLLAFIDATEIRHWSTWLAAIVFFAAPAATILSGWSRWRRYRQ
jgi:anti-sigma factor RsiW